MYILEISDNAGKALWFEGKGWYWTDMWFILHGPYMTEEGAAYDYAWHINDAMNELSDNWSRH